MQQLHEDLPVKVSLFIYCLSNYLYSFPWIGLILVFISYRKALNIHVKRKHADGGDDVDDPRGENLNFACAMCDYRGGNYFDLTSHMTQLHNFKDDIEERDFKSMEEFKAWKECMEGKELVSFVKDRGVRKLVRGRKILFRCHRSGFVKRQGRGIRLEKKTCKIGAVCPARMEVLWKDDGSISLTWHKSHFGHEFDMNFLRLTATERGMIETRLKNHETLDSILDDVRESLTKPSDFSRIHLLEKKDLWNMLRKVDFKNRHAHAVDSISVDVLVETLRKRGDKDPILFYKPQDKPCACTDPQCCLDDSDFMIVISTPYQREELAHFLDHKAFIDSTHGTNEYDFQLTALGSVDSAGVGVPVAFCISNRVTENFMKQFFRILKDNLRKDSSSSKVFMSDMANEFYNAWKDVFGECENVFYCAWHVDKRWREKTKEKVKGLTKQAEVYRALITLRNITDREWFDVDSLAFREMIKQDPDTLPFLEYIDGYLKCKEKWAYCYRGGLGLNVNMFSESMFKTLKYSYARGKKMRRVDECLNMLLRWVRNIAFERMTRLCKGNNSYRQRLINESHKRSKEIKCDLIVELETNAQWKVPSAQPGSEDFYHVSRNAENTCSGCELYCNLCSVCIHEFKCTCLDYVSHGNMCKHIHAVASTHLVFDESDRRLAQRVEEGIEALCNLGVGNCDVGAEVEKNDMWKPVCENLKTCLDRLSGVNVSSNVIDHGLKFLELLRKEMQAVPSPTSSPTSSPSPTVPPTPTHPVIPSTPTTPASGSRNSFTPLSKTPHSANKKVSTQRRLLNFRSTKKKPVKKARNLAKPTFYQQSSYLANFALGPDYDVLNVHANEFDHSYTKMDIDDNY